MLSVSLLTATDPVKAKDWAPDPPIATFSISSAVLALTSKEPVLMREAFVASAVNEASVVVVMRLTATPIPIPAESP